VESLAPRFNDNAMALVNAVKCPQLIASTKGVFPLFTRHFICCSNVVSHTHFFFLFSYFTGEPPSWKPNGTVQQALSTKPFAALNEVYVYEKVS
jgi:hypothetical protein